MFQLVVSDLDDSDLVISKWATKAIGLLDPNLQGVIPKKENYLQLFFHDCDEPIHPEYEAVSPERFHVEQALAFSSSFKENDRILVHCHAGVSRSSAIAIAVFLQHGLEPFEAFEHTSRTSRLMYPNKLILHYTDAILGLNNRLIDYHEIWLQNMGNDKA